jgi:hypothetical protein
VAEPFTIRVFVPDGNPDSIRIIDRMNWTGRCVDFPRSRWPEVKQRPEFGRAGVYILSGVPGQDDDLPTLYIGQAESVATRIESHYQNKDFWDRGLVFVSTGGGLNRAHVSWLEYALIARATEANRCRLDNGNMPQEPSLAEAEKADTQSFLKEILQILPLLGLHAFEVPKPVAIPKATSKDAAIKSGDGGPDTIVVPAQKEGFEKVFLGEDCWYAVRISGGILDKLKFVAVYVGSPISAITHYAPIDRIEPYGEDGKYKLIFSEKAKPIGPIHFADSPKGSMQHSRYTKFETLKTATKLTELFGRD